MPPPLTPPPSGEAYRTSKDALTEDEVGRIVEARGGGGGADSIVGLSNADGGALNYEETVVYRNEAAIPSYLIVYRLP